MTAFIRSFYACHREGADYIIAGVIVTAVNWVVYTLLVAGCGMGVTAANTAAWFLAVLAAFILNKCFVFRSRTWRPAALLREAAAFLGGRVFSGAVEIGLVPLLMALGVTWSILNIEGFAAKFIAQAVSMVLNYFLGKYAVFRGRG